MQGDADEGTPAEARRMADQVVALVKRKTGLLVQYDPPSLAVMDSLIDGMRASGVSEEQASGMIYAVGCYVGEVMVRHAGGEWRPTGELGMTQVCSWPIVIALPDGAGNKAGYNPIGKAFKRFRNGGSDSLVFFWQLVQQMPRIIEERDRQ